ncbi:MAG: hypothetical protein OK454_03955, partial [Thaumarchaeota archaeon]|nr:hypothetical protein [Nitrososphaerota archaeon]
MFEEFAQRMEVGDDAADVVVVAHGFEIFGAIDEELLHLGENALVEVFGVALDERADFLLDHGGFAVAGEAFEFEDAAGVVIGDDAEPNFGLDGVEIAAHFFHFLGALEVDDDFGDAEEIVGEVGQADVGGKEELDVDAALREEPAADHVVKEVAGVEAVFAEEKDGEGARRFAEVGPADEREHVGKTGALKGERS